MEDNIENRTKLEKNSSIKQPKSSFKKFEIKNKCILLEEHSSGRN